MSNTAAFGIYRTENRKLGTTRTTILFLLSWVVISCICVSARLSTADRIPVVLCRHPILHLWADARLEQPLPAETALQPLRDNRVALHVNA